MVQEEGAACLERGDAAMTQAAMFNTTIAPIKAGFHLVTSDRREHPEPVGACFSNGALATVTAFLAGATSLTNRETIVFGPASPPLEVFHTPGQQQGQHLHPHGRIALHR